MDVQPRLTGMFTPSSQTLRIDEDIKYGRSPAYLLPHPYDQDVDALVALQREHGFQLISDGQMAWGDLFRPVYTGMQGVEPGSQTRWFETNGFVYPPKIVATPEPGEPAVPGLLSTGTPAPTQVSLIGLSTLLQMTENQTSIPPAGIAEAFVEQYRRNIAALPESVTLVEFIDPAFPASILSHEYPADAAQAIQSYSRVLNAVDRAQRQFILTFPWRDFNTLASSAGMVPADGYGADLLETTGPSSTIANVFNGKILSAGVLDAWSSVPELLEDAARRVHGAMERWHPELTYVTTNAQLYYTISHKPAVRKVEELRKLAEALS